MKADQKPIILLELADTLLRQWWTIVAGACIGLAGATVALSLAEPIYKTGTTICFSENVPRDFIRSVVSDDITMQIRAAKDAVFRREEVPGLVAQNYGAVEGTPLHEEQVRQTKPKMSAGYSAQVDCIWTGYVDNDPKRAAEMSNGLTRLMVEELAKLRAGEAGEATQSLEALAARYKEKLDEKESELKQLRMRHPFLNEQGAFPQRTQDLPVQLEEIDGQIAELTKKLRVYEFLQVQEELLDASGERFVASEMGAKQTAGSRLAQLERELDEKRLRYSDSHPDVRHLKRQIEELRQDQGAEDTGEAIAYRPTVSPWQAQLLAARRELEQLQSDRQRVQRQVQQSEERMASVPIVQQQMFQLQDEIKLLRDRYFEYRTKAETARGSQMFEEQQQGKQFEVVNWAGPPKIPSWPDPFQIFGVALAAGLALFVGPVLLKHLLRPAIRSEARLKQISEIPLLVSIPSMATPGKLRKKRRQLQMNLGLSALSIAILAATIVMLP